MLKMILSDLTILDFSFILFSSCKKDENQITIPEFTFAKVGNTSVFMLESNFDGKISRDTIMRKYESMLENNVWKVLDLIAPNDIRFEYVSKTEYSWMDDPSGKNTFPIINSTSKVNDIYTFLYDGDTIYNKVIAVEEKVVVPAGTFECYKTISYFNSTVGSFYVNGKYGLIKYYEAYGSGYVKLELISKNF